MDTLTMRINALLLGALLGLAAMPASADDTEIFVATSNPLLTGAQPNILFVYDNSGSMDSEVVTQVAWDPNVTFDGCYESNGLYFSTTGTKPSCGSNYYINASANNCAASDGPLKTVGVFSDGMLAWRSYYQNWVVLNGNNKSRPMECQDDRGIHGPNSGGGDTYAANGAGGPWEPNANNEPNFSTNYTIWNGNWLNWNASGGTVTKTRIEVVREVTNSLLDSLNGVNVGLMHFNSEQGGLVRQAMADIATSRQDMKDAVNSLTANGWTPLSETLYEATNYYMGRDVDYGNVGPILSVGASRTSGTTSGTTYKRPATLACQKNYIVLLTDGLPTRDVSATPKIQALPDWASTVPNPTCGTNGKTNKGGENGPPRALTDNGVCMPSLAAYLNLHDLDPALAGLQNVTTYTVGFGVDVLLGDTSILQETAELGGGEYYPAGDTASLQSALSQIVFDILEDASTYSTPTAPVNAFNRTQNLADVFVSVFSPAINAHWPGNLKKYRFVNNVLTDQSGQPAVDPGTGFFKDTAQSFWSDSVDGARVESGGAANELPLDTARNLYTDVAGPDLNATGNAVAKGNGSITAAMIGAPDAERDAVIDRARGLDNQDDDDDGDYTDVSHIMGDPLHVPPVMVIYGGTDAAPDATVFVSTNDGYLHAINPVDGSELWSFMPSELLERLYALYLDDPTPTRSYGLDGEIRVYIDNNDGVAGISGSERVILYFGMRRGGDALYALEVTDRNDPQLLWKLSSATAGFGNLGQTWSTPSIVKLDIGGTERQVAIFGGGYDDGQDLVGFRTDTRGNAIYMVDAFTGQLLWSAGNGVAYNLNLADMQHSIPAAIKVLDLDLNGKADRMYAADMGGRVWRFDIFNGQSGSELVQGGVFATLGAADIASPALADVRRFYATPDVAQIITDQRMYLSVSLGSGHREHPLDTGTNEEFYSLRDFNVFEQLTNDQYGTPIVRSDLVDITSDTTPELPYDALGWRLTLDLSPGEKVVAESLTFQNTLFFTSFSPGGNGDACVAAGGLNRVYEISVLDGSPRTNLDGSIDPNDPEGGPGELTPEDRYQALSQGGLAPEPVIFFEPEPLRCVGVECAPPGFGNAPVRTRWNQDGTE
jgi:type IV pilus assembly protein PilY1